MGAGAGTAGQDTGAPKARMVFSVRLCAPPHQRNSRNPRFPSCRFPCPGSSGRPRLTSHKACGYSAGHFVIRRSALMAKQQRIAILGTGYVGLVAAAVFADRGF
ncbi:MAG: hypothetical protein JXQ75_22135, partial [Phycisphaerae bacterium]|nr:hypothetical protein [Phycisphaerae bacterium]